MGSQTTNSLGFDRELANAQFPLLAYILKQVGNFHDAEDVLQEVNLKLCKERGTYDTSKPFLPWAKTLARFEAMTWRKRQSRSKLVFSEELMDQLAETFAQSQPEEDETLGERLAALEECRKRLSPDKRDLLDRHYLHGEKISDIAASLHRPPGSVANALYRIRALLYTFMKERLP